jgi:hypothetical protein
VDKLFSLQPKQSLRSEEQRLLGKNGSAEYSQGADGSRPGVFYVPIPDIRI